MSYTIIKDPAIEPFHISKDQYCYTVVETITPDAKNLEEGVKGKEYEKPLGHYGDLAAALKKIAKAKIDLKNEYTSVMEYVGEFEKQTKAMDELLNKIGI